MPDTYTPGEKFSGAALFLCLCMGTRILLALGARSTEPRHLPILGVGALLLAVGFAVAFNRRHQGAETFGQPIWWNSLRPVHAVLWGVFAVGALQKKNWWFVLLGDAVLGLGAFGVQRTLLQ